MIVIYYEFYDINGNPFYYHRINKNNTDRFSLLVKAQRAWKYDTKLETVEFIKNRIDGFNCPVDREEFELIQIMSMDKQNDFEEN